MTDIDADEWELRVELAAVYRLVDISWLNLVERLFAEVTQRCVRRGSYTAVKELEKAMLA